MNRLFMTLAMLIFSVGWVSAQDTEITLTPVRDSTFHLSGVAPEGWGTFSPRYHML